MNIKSCGFTCDNLRVMVSNGVVYLGNAEDKRMYEVVVVKPYKTKRPTGSKTIKVRKGEQYAN